MEGRKFNGKRKRHEQIITLLKEEDALTCNKLASLIGVSLRTLMRDLKELVDEGIPVETDVGRGGGVRINRRYGVSKVNFNYKEIVDFILALAIIEKLNSPLFFQDIKSLKNKIIRAFPEDQREIALQLRKRIFIGNNASSEVFSSYKLSNSKIIEDLYIAFFEMKKVFIFYKSRDGKKTRRVIEPHFMLLNWPVWYVYGWDDLREENRYFRVDRILKCELRNDKFKLKYQTTISDEIISYFNNL